MLIQFITTGGTIDKIYHDANNDYEVGEPQVIALLNEARVTIDYEVVALFRKDSLDLTEVDRGVIVETIEQSTAKQIIVTHGTDTMVDTADLLRGIPGKVIVLTGSLAPARFKISDAEFNLGMAIAAVQCLEPGAYITMNGKVFSAGSVVKNRTKNRFESVDEEPN
jgi:L-asparaginase